MQRLLQVRPLGPPFWPLLVALSLISSRADGDQLVAAQNDHERAPFEDALSPDDTLFAHLRCFERFASKHGPDRERDVTDWLGTSERYVHPTARTPNFVRCILTELRLFDPREEQFNATILEQQFNKYNRWMTLSEDLVLKFVSAVQSVSIPVASSDAVYVAFEQLFSNHSTAYFELFLRDPNVLQKLINQEEFLVRKPNQTVIQFCELQMDEDLWDDICRIRAYEISNRTDAMRAHITCIFRGFRYLNGAGFIDENEIVQDFIEAAVLDDASGNHVKQCVKDSHHEQAISKRSLRMYACLLDGPSGESFKEAFDFREVRSGNLTYLWRNLPYERDQVKHQILALDKERCDDQQQPTGRALRD